MYLILQHIFKHIWIPLIGIIGCLLPIHQLVLGSHSYLTYVTDNYSTLGILVFLLLFTFYTMLKLRVQKSTHWLPEALLGVYLMGWAIFMLYRIFMLFANKHSYGLANQLDASSFPREGLFLILISGCLLFYRGLIKQKQ